MKRTKKRGSTQELIDVETFTKYGVMTGSGELIFFAVAPTNVAVLSKENVEQKINHLKNLLLTIPDIEFVCSDSCECFDANIAYIAGRAEQESNPQVRAILEKDREFFNSAQSESSTARQFIFLMRLRREKPEQRLAAISNVLQTIEHQQFNVCRLEKPQLKRFLAIYFGACTDGDRMPDNDGDQYAEVICDDEM